MKKNLIGFIVPDSSNRFINAIIQTTDALLKDSDFHLVVTYTNYDLNCEIEKLEQFQSFTTGILLISSATNFSLIEKHITPNFPLIFLSNKLQNCTYPTIIENDYLAVFQSVMALIADGHTKIGCICGSTFISTTKERAKAYTDAIAISPEGFLQNRLRYLTLHEKPLPQIISDLVESGCTAIIGGNHDITIGLLNYTVTQGFQHNEIEISGFANSNTINALHSRMNLVLQPVDDFAKIAVQQLLYRIQHTTTPSQVYVLKGLFRARTAAPFYY